MEKQLGLGENSRFLVEQCIATSSFYILGNRSSYRFFHIGREIHQGRSHFTISFLSSSQFFQGWFYRRNVVKEFTEWNCLVHACQSYTWNLQMTQFYLHELMLMWGKQHKLENAWIGIVYGLDNLSMQQSHLYFQLKFFYDNSRIS